MPLFDYQRQIQRQVVMIVTDAINKGDLIIEVHFNDGSISNVNVGDYIRRHPHPQYNKYLDPKKFRRFYIENGNVVWGKNWDMIFPVEQLYDGYLK